MLHRSWNGEETAKTVPASIQTVSHFVRNGSAVSTVDFADAFWFCRFRQNLTLLQQVQISQS